MIKTWTLLCITGLAVSGMAQAQQTLSPVEQAALCRMPMEKGLKTALQSGALQKKPYIQDYDAYYFPARDTQAFGGRLLAVVYNSMQTTKGKYVGCCASESFSVLVEGADNAALRKLVPNDGVQSYQERGVGVKRNAGDDIDVLQQAMKTKSGAMIPRRFAGLNAKSVVEVVCKPED